jgi:uncharacterized protein (TIGR03435 family)
MLQSIGMKRLGHAIFVLGLFGAPEAIRAQAATPKATFEVASVKLVKGPVAPHGVGLLINHGKLTIEAGQLRQIIGLAYGVQRVLVRNCPDWCDEDMFDVLAKTDNVDATRDQIRPMLQALLEDRFKLMVHRETKDVPGFELAVSRKGAKLPLAKDDPGPVNVFTPRGGGLDFHNMALVGLCNYLANVLGQPVRDNTGLTERYNFFLEFRPPDAGPNPPAVPQAEDFSGLVFSAVEEQLGLKLQRKLIPGDVLIVDRAEHPSDN